MRLLLIRHAESAGNAAGIIQGHAEYPLSARGERQAALLAARLAQGPALDALFASPLQRADATARAIAVLTALPVQPLAALKEYDFGAGNGMAMQEARETYGRDPDGFLRFPGEEGRAAFRERVCAALWALESEFSDAAVAVVTHAGPIGAFCVAVLGLPYAGRAPFPIRNASVTTVDVHDGKGTVLGINDTCHLEALDGA